MSALTITTVISVTAILISFTYTNYKVYLIKNKMNRNLELSLLIKEMLSIEREYIYLKNKYSLHNFDKVEQYIQQNSLLLDKCKLDINLKRVIIQEARHSDEEFKKFLNQLVKAPKEVQQLVFRRNDTVGKVIELKRPYYFKFMCLKKRVAIKILSTILEILTFIAKRIPDNRIIRDKQELWLDSNIALARVGDINRMKF